MNQEPAHYRGVFCQCCRQPIPVPGIVMRIEALRGGARLGDEHAGRAFSLRCRSCEKEMPYRTRDIVEIPGAPKPRVSRAYGRALGRREDLSRAANA